MNAEEADKITNHLDFIRVNQRKSAYKVYFFPLRPPR